MLIINCHISIVVPFVIKKCLYSLSDLNIDTLVSVKSLQKTKESCKCITIIKILIQCINLFKNFNEVSHDVWKDSNAKEKNSRTEDPFKLTSWIIISKTNCSQWSEWIIHSNDSLFIIGSLRNLKCCHKVFNLELFIFLYPNLFTVFPQFFFFCLFHI